MTGQVKIARGLVAELAYAYGSGPYSERIAGSTPAQSTGDLR